MMVSAPLLVSCCRSLMPSRRENCGGMRTLSVVAASSRSGWLIRCIEKLPRITTMHLAAQVRELRAPGINKRAKLNGRCPNPCLRGCRKEIPALFSRYLRTLPFQPLISWVNALLHETVAVKDAEAHQASPTACAAAHLQAPPVLQHPWKHPLGLLAAVTV